MTTSRPEVKIYEPSEKGATVMRKASFRNTGSDRYVRLSDYEALQDAYEGELFTVRQTRDSHFGEMMRAFEQVDALQAECEKLRTTLSETLAMTRKTVTLPLDVGGGWHLFTYHYASQDGEFSGYLHALDMGHAEQLLREMCATAVLAGQMIEVIDPNGGIQMGKFNRGDLVRKIGGSEWSGRVVGEYSTSLTPEGYAVESEAHSGSVQIYPAGALEPIVNKESK